MAENLLDVVMVNPGEQACVMQLKNELRSLQSAVGGLIECVPLGNGALLVCNDEGKLNGMPPNRRLGDDIIAGPFFICGAADGDFVSLTEKELAHWQKEFFEPQSITPEETAASFRFEVRGFDL